MKSQAPFRILSLDGGGIRGALSATILKQVEKQILEQEGQSLSQYFDLIAGTSTGSILAAGTALGLNAETMFNLYQKQGNDIFSPQTRCLRKWLPGGGELFFPFTRYSNKGLIKVLKENLIFQDKKGSPPPTLVDIERSSKKLPSLLILAYNTSDSYTEYFASNATYREGGEPTWNAKIPIWQACVCSSAAPTFFPPYELVAPAAQGGEKFNNYIDGGVAANNPDLAAITHSAYTKTRINPDGSLNESGLALSDMSVLSIGTGKVKHSFDYKTVDSWGLIDWARQISDIFMAAPTDFEEKVTRQLLSIASSKKLSERYLRLNIDIEPSLSAIDDPNVIGGLVNAYEEQSSRLPHYNFETGRTEHRTIEELVNDFIMSNKRSPGQHFKDRFEANNK